jgi:hypothetical protein
MLSLTLDKEKKHERGKSFEISFFHFPERKLSNKKFSGLEKLQRDFFYQNVMEIKTESDEKKPSNIYYNLQFV